MACESPILLTLASGVSFQEGVPGGHLVVPFSSADGATIVQYTFVRAGLRVDAAAAGDCQADVEISSGTGNFSVVDSVTVSLSAGSFETATAPALLTVSSGYKLRVNPVLVSGSGSWSVEVILAELP